MSYQITISGKGTSKPMAKDEAAAWGAILRINFPGVTVLAIPILCPECGHPLPDSGPCWHNLFQEETVTSEEILESLIPFQGEPMPNKERTIQEFYGI